jgi:hypothetical protein
MWQCLSNSLPDRLLRLLLPIGALCFAILLGVRGAIWAPDAAQYRLLALGQHSAVPAPFSARILGPAIAAWLGRQTGFGVDTGFLVLGVACLVALLGLVAGILWAWRAPTVIFAGIFLMPFWVDIFHDYYLPDPLHAAILAAMLLLLLRGRSEWAMLLLLPAYLARESTSLVAACLILACWRRIPLRSAVIGVLALMGAVLVSGHYSHGGPANVHGITGGSYILGKLVWSFFKNVLGLPLWSNTLPECAPVWVKTIPVALGGIREVGMCQPSLWGPSRLLLAWFGLFGIGPAVALVLWKKVVFPVGSPETDLPGLPVVLRFSVLYGLISILMTPLLGASVDRLVSYGWPFYFVALPWFLFQRPAPRGVRALGLLVLHLLTCWLAWWGFRQPSLGFLAPGLAVFGLNGLAYALLRGTVAHGGRELPSVTY